MTRVGENTYVDLEGAQRMLKYFDELLSSVDALQENDPWPEVIQITVNTSVLCDMRSCLLKLAELLKK